MSAGLVASVYIGAIVVALALLYFFRAQRWYWHVLSVVLAVGLGLLPVPAEWHTPAFDLSFGFTLTFLLLWGVAAPLFRKSRVTRHA